MDQGEKTEYSVECEDRPRANGTFLSNRAEEKVLSLVLPNQRMLGEPEEFDGSLGQRAWPLGGVNGARKPRDKGCCP